MKMVQFLSLTILIVVITEVSSQFRQSHFIKSVFEINSRSVASTKSKRQSDINSNYQCAITCTSDDLCTRYEFCPNSPVDKCTLYQSGSTCQEVNNEKTYAGCECFRMKWMKYEDESCRCPVGYYGNGDQCCQHVIQDCSEGVTLSHLAGRSYIITFIKPLTYSGEPFEVICMFFFGGYTFIQNRRKADNSINFHTNWINYRNGFGTFHGNHWLGLEKVYHILKNNNSNGFRLEMHLKNESNSQCTWNADKFSLNDESSNYTPTFQNLNIHYNTWCNLMFGNLTPNARPFSTYDHVSDPNNFNCTGREESGWWFADDVDCSFSNLNSQRINGNIVVQTSHNILTKLSLTQMRLNGI